MPLALLLTLLLSSFLLSLGLIVYALLQSRRQVQVEERLTQYVSGISAEAAIESPTAPQPERRTSPLGERLDRLMKERGWGEGIARKLAQANLKFTPGEFVATRVIAGLVSGAMIWLIARARGIVGIDWVLLLLGGIVGSYLPEIWVAWRRRKRIQAFNSQLADTLSLLANSIRSGYSLLQSMELLARETPSPTREEFDRVVKEVGLGLSTQEALQNLLRRIPSDDLDLMVTAISIQMEVGGNLAQMLETISHTIRERVRIKGEIRALTAQQRGAAYIVASLPIVTAIIFTLMRPDYMRPLFTVGLPPDGWICMPIFAGIMEIIGFIVMMKIADIEV